MNNPTKIDDITSGMEVKIEKQRDLGTYVNGIIAEVISKSDHPQGLFVKLTSGEKGRAKEILSSNIISLATDSDHQTKEYRIEPESSKIEYKEHFIYYHNEMSQPNLKWVVEHSIYKSIAAFANGEGGKLIIGIHDNGTIFGLEKDYEELQKIKEKNPKSIYKPDRDGMELKIKNDCAHYFPNQKEIVLDFINKISFPRIKNLEICVIEVSPTYENPLVMYDRDSSQDNKKGPLFYVRKGNSSENYRAEEFLQYWVRRVKNKSKF